MAIHRGIQSALFYYLSCAPCSDHRYRKRRKQAAVRDRAERDVLEAENPNLYRHPSPSSTNPHWQAEIELGPNHPPRGKRRTHNPDGARPLKSAGTQRSSGSNDTLSLDMRRSASQDSRWDSKIRVTTSSSRDEMFGGLDGTHPARVIRRTNTASTTGDSVAVPARLRTKTAATSDPPHHGMYRNPPISDLHPAITTRVESREDVSWMLQPPPPAEPMLGKHRNARRRSDSNESRGSMPSIGHISRQSSIRRREDALPDLIEQSPLNLEHPISISSTHGRLSAKTSPRLNPVDCTDQQDFAHHIPITSTRKVDTRQVPPVSLVVRPSTAHARPRIHAAKSETHTGDARGGLQRPYVRVSSPKQEVFSFIPSPRTPQRDQPSGSIPYDEDVADPSLSVIRSLAPHSRFLKRTATSPSPQPSSPLSANDQRFDGLENWQRPDFELGEWVREHTKREVIERWSMDI